MYYKDIVTIKNLQILIVSIVYIEKKIVLKILKFTIIWLKKTHTFTLNVAKWST